MKWYFSYRHIKVESVKQVLDCTNKWICKKKNSQREAKTIPEQATKLLYKTDESFKY